MMSSQGQTHLSLKDGIAIHEFETIAKQLDFEIRNVEISVWPVITQSHYKSSNLKQSQKFKP